MEPAIGTWTEWANHVLAELERLDGNQKEFNEKLGKINNSIITLKVRAGIWGGIAGFLGTGILTIIVNLLIK